MNVTIRRTVLGMTFAAGVLAGSGCQTYEVGQVMPSPYHLKDDVQYFPRGPRFPLANELNAQQAAEAEREATP